MPVSPFVPPWLRFRGTEMSEMRLGTGTGKQGRGQCACWQQAVWPEGHTPPETSALRVEGEGAVEGDVEGMSLEV